MLVEVFHIYQISPSSGQLEGGTTGVTDDAPQVLSTGSAYGADLGTVDRSVGRVSEGTGTWNRSAFR